MNRHYLMGVIICIGVATGFAGSKPALGQTGTYVTDITCTNLDISDAQLSLIFYTENTTTNYSYEDPNLLNPGRSVIYLLPTSPAGSGLPSSFTGSAFVSSDKKIACSQKTQRNDASVGTQSVPARIGEANGVNVYTESSNTLYAPQVMRNFYTIWNSYISVQNTGLTDVVVTITYKRRTVTPSTAIPTETFTIPPQRSHIFNQATNGNLPTDDNSGFSGSATITTGNINDRITASVTFYNAATSYGTSQFQSYNAFRSGATKLIVPRFVRNYYGFNSGITIQNINSNAITVYITFTYPGGTYYVTRSLASGEEYSGYASGIPELAPVDNAAVHLRTGSAVVTTSGGSAVAIVNEDNRGYCTPANVCTAIPANQVSYSSTYNAFLDDGTATSKVVFPKISKNVGTYFAGGWQISNITPSTATCGITYGNVGAADQSLLISGNGSLSIFLPNVPNLPDGFNDAVTVSCPGIQIQGISNSSGRITTTATYWGDSFTTVNGFSK